MMLEKQHYKKKVIISSCILGEICRYDGKLKKFQGVIDAFKEYQIIPFCPEAPLFGTPRERINIVRIDNKEKIITEETKKDVTLLLKSEIDSFIKQNSDIDAIVLKSKSPTCGSGTTPILNEQNQKIAFGDGIAVSIFKTKYSNIQIKDENDTYLF